MVYFGNKYYSNSRHSLTIFNGFNCKKAFSLAIAHFRLQKNKILRRRKTSRLLVRIFFPASAASPSPLKKSTSTSLVIGKEISPQLFATVKEFDLTTKKMIQHYKKCSGLTDAKIREVLLPPQDIWLSPLESKKLGLCDDVKELS